MADIIPFPIHQRIPVPLSQARTVQEVTDILLEANPDMPRIRAEADAIKMLWTLQERLPTLDR